MVSAMESHFPLVRKIAGRLARRLPRHVAIDDLISAGSEGLVDAARRFDPRRGVAFGAYAEIRIRGAVMDELRLHDFVPRGVRQRQRTMERRHAAWAGASVPPLSASTGQVFFVTMDHPDALAIRNGDAPPDEALERSEAIARLRRALRSLPERLQTVLSLYYVEELTLKEIGAVMGVTESRVCQLHAQALGSMRKALHACQR